MAMQSRQAAGELMGSLCGEAALRCRSCLVKSDIYTLNGKFAFAVAMTQVQRRGAENFARAMGMCVPML
jgi:hypothetical protein